MDILENIMAARNSYGTQCENNQREDEAVRLYEANVKEHFGGSHPYERLRIIYEKHRRYADAIRVCREFVVHGQGEDELKKKYSSLIEQLIAQAANQGIDERL